MRLIYQFWRDGLVGEGGEGAQNTHGGEYVALDIDTPIVRQIRASTMLRVRSMVIGVYNESTSIQWIK